MRNYVTVLRKDLLLICLLHCFLFGTPLQAQENKPSPDESVIRAIKQTHERAARAVKEGDVAAYVELFAEDGIYMWPNEPAIVGREALSTWFAKRFREYSAEIEKTIDEIVIMGDWAFDRGNEVSKITTRSSGDEKVAHGKYINVFQKQSDGSWKIARRIRNPNHPPSK